jgi:hypothetical protein
MSDKGPVHVVLGPNYAVRLRDLREWHRLAVYCCACRHVATLTPKVVIAQLKRRRPSTAETMDLKALEKRLVCSECGVRDCCSVKVVMPGRAGRH